MDQLFIISVIISPRYIFCSSGLFIVSVYYTYYSTKINIIVNNQPGCKHLTWGEMICIHMNFECLIKVYHVKLRFNFIVSMAYTFPNASIPLDSTIKVGWSIRIVMTKTNYN